MAQFNFQAIGTTWKIDIYSELAEKESAAILLAVRDRIDAFDKAYSRFREDSLVTRMSRESGVFQLPDDAEPMMSVYRDLYERTGGLVTPLIGNLISDAGYDARYSLRQKKKLEMPPEWDEALEYAHPMLTVKKAVLLDFGAAGKGYLVDLVAEALEARGISGYCIDAGGDILHRGPTPIRVGLEDPEDAGKVIGICGLGNGSICGSAGNRRAWGDFTHIIDPKTLASPRDILAVWVTAETALVADALATCLFFVPPSALAGGYDVEYLLVRSDRSLEKSVGFPGEAFLS